MRWVLLSAAAAVGMALFLPAAAPQGWYEIWKPARTGITWRHDNGISARRYIPETMGPGVAIFDYNNDGLMDLYFPNSGPCDFFQPSRPLRGALYRNNGDGTFTDVTECGVFLQAGHASRLLQHLERPAARSDAGRAVAGPGHEHARSRRRRAGAGSRRPGRPRHPARAATVGAP